MNGARRLMLIAASLTLVCFFLPWVRASFGGSGDSASGFDRVREDHALLWLVPALSLTVIIFGTLGAVWRRAALLFALSGTAGGFIIAYLMYVVRANDTRGAIIPVAWTVWYWLGLLASLVIAAAAFVFYAGQTRSK